MIYLIGLGLDLKDISLKSIDLIKFCDKIYLETYTTTFPYKIEDLEKTIGKKVILANREKIENGLNALIKEAKKQNFAILVYGDPLSATTHITIVREAKKQKVEIEIIHNVSILTSIADVGLQLYKFGKTISIPKWSKNFRPTSFYQLIKDNLSIKAHSLLLIDPGMSLKEALKEIQEASEGDSAIIDKELIVASKISLNDQLIIKGKISELINKEIDEPFSIIVPGELNFSEEE
jgi:diphthine synthase